MTLIYHCLLELHDHLYYATREIGRLYETEAVLHNYGLCYALGLVDSEIYATQTDPDHGYRYFCGEQIPAYEAHLSRLNEAGIYVTPARSCGHTTVLTTWKYANNAYHVQMHPTQKNIPSYGRAKEIAPESRFEFFVITQQPIALPHWIRLGKWSSKAEVTVECLGSPTLMADATHRCSLVLNPLDVMFTHRVISFDTINMPPVSLIQNALIQGSWYELGEDQRVRLPARMSFRFRHSLPGEDR